MQNTHKDDRANTATYFSDNWHDEACSSRQDEVPDRQGESFGSSFQGRVGGQRKMGLGHAQRQLIVALNNIDNINIEYNDNVANKLYSKRNIYLIKGLYISGISLSILKLSYNVF